jgi:hypothetical protein
MKLSAYILRSDTGFAPNPFGYHCTLACCKPTIRRKAVRGDIIIGTTSISTHAEAGRLIYAMRVTRDPIPYQTYFDGQTYAYKKPSKKTAIQRLGDNIWHQHTSDEWRCLHPAQHDERHRERDLRGVQVLVSTDFYYFGRAAIRIPARFSQLVAVTQGHRNTYDEALIKDFWAWVEREAPKPGRIADPFNFTEEGCRAQREDIEDDDEPEENEQGLNPVMQPMAGRCNASLFL